ncbi:MAG: hypothetical protein ACK4FZ_16980 [Vogesella sp.]|uniref:hypothetical protein n=1 Tax=Vogesella sp. TaxID=1904252 RepID=UPI00391DAE70
MAPLFSPRDLFYLQQLVRLEEARLGRATASDIFELAWFIELAWYCGRVNFRDPPRRLRECRERILPPKPGYIDDGYLDEDLFSALQQGVICAMGVLDRFSLIYISDAARYLKRRLQEASSGTQSVAPQPV